MKLILSKTPPSTSNIYFHKGHLVYMSDEGKNTKELYKWEIKSQYPGGIPVKRDVKVSIDFYFKNNLRRDLDNYNKLVLDACTGIMWEDDSQIQELTLRKFIDKNNSRVEIIIE